MIINDLDSGRAQIISSELIATMRRMKEELERYRDDNE